MEQLSYQQALLKNASALAETTVAESPPTNIAELGAMMLAMNAKLQQLDSLPSLSNNVESIQSQVSEIVKIKEDLKNIDTKLDSFIEKCNANSEKIKALDLDVKSIDARVKKLESNQVQLVDRETIKRELAFSMNRIFEVVIFGLSPLLLQNKSTTVPKIANLLGLSHEDWHVSYMREIRTRRNGTTLLLLHFVSPVFRANWLSAKRKKGDLKCSEIEPGQPDNLVYINQRETIEERRLFIEARNFARSQNYYGCWMSDGKIFFKKTQGSRPISYAPRAPHEENEHMDVSNSESSGT